jgi:hypothetical protein
MTRSWAAERATLIALACLSTAGCGGETSSVEPAPGAGGQDASAGSGGSGGMAGAAASGGSGASAGQSGSGGSGGVGATGGQAGSAGTGPGGTGGGAGTGPGGTGGQAGAAGGGGACGACTPLEQCWNGQLCVAKSVTIPGGYAIDATEVTRSQYATWLATNPTTGGQPAFCSWNASLLPDATCMSKPSVCSGAACANHPQVCVDHCDADAYCRAVGKRLCGAIAGGPVSITFAKDPTKSQWHNACTSGGVNDFAYGNAPNHSACNDYFALSKTTVPVASMSACQSPVAAYAGVFDLIGNAAEMEDNCTGTAGASDICHPRGLSFGMGAAMPRCDSDLYAKRSEVWDTNGFRCCAP